MRGCYPALRNAAAACQRSQSAWMPIQNSGDMSNNRASRSAVCAVMPRRPRTTSFKRFSGMFHAPGRLDLLLLKILTEDIDVISF